MDAITRAAITGTSREAPPAGDLPTDHLLGSARDRSPERDLLLRAGMYAVYRAAGRKAETGIEAPVPASEEMLHACTAKAAEIVRQLLTGRRDDILYEALERLRLAGLRLPHALLPSALDVQHRELRPDVAAVLGERGRWLARFNPAWTWVGLRAGAVTAEVDEAVWEEGSLPERLDALGRVRGLDADQGLRWVDEVWKTEKAEVRAGMVAALETGLSTGDEPLLERALDDRSVRVREAAAELLARIPGSAYAGRAVARADAVLVGYEQARGGLLGRRRAGGFVVEPPEDVDGGWRRDLPGVDKPPQGVGEQAWGISRAIAAVPPGHWEKRFGVGPSGLVAGAHGEWEAALLVGLCRAARLHGNESWALPLWRRCYEVFDAGGEYTIAWGATRPLVPLLPQPELAAALRELLRNGEMTVRMVHALDALPGPWAHEFGIWYLESLRDRVHRAFSTSSDSGDRWTDTLGIAAEKLPPSCFRYAHVSPPDEASYALEGEDFPNVQREPYHLGNWRRELEKFGETLDLRRRLVKEIPL